MVWFEVLGVEVDCDVISQYVVVGEGEVDDVGELIVEKEDVVVEEIGVDDVLWQMGGLDFVGEMIEFGGEKCMQVWLYFVGVVCGGVEQWLLV